jgi:RNA polymerase sigma-70 factor (ECF subfamily)
MIGDNTPRTDLLLKYQPWLNVLARLEIDSRFAGKFSPSDVVQQTMLEAWRDWQDFRGDEEEQRRAWLRQILAHQLAHLARHYAGTQKRDVSREVQLQASLNQTSLRLECLAADQTSPSGLLEAREQALQLARVLEELPADYRQVLTLRHVEDLPHEEIAQRMNRSVGAVRMLWVRALAELRGHFERGTSMGGSGGRLIR